MAKIVVMRIMDGSFEPLAALRLMSVDGIRVRPAVFIANKVHMAKLALLE